MNVPHDIWPGEDRRLKAVVLDWAGTVVDFGSLAPMGAFVKLFARYGVTISTAHARVPMGLHKWDHIHAIGQMEDVAQQWLAAHGTPFSDADVDELYDVFTPMNRESVRDHAALIPGALATVNALRDAGLRIGSTTGYNKDIMVVLQALARDQGYVPDTLVCVGDTPAGRPSPLMMYRCFADLGVWPPAAVLKVDDTVPGIAEGLNAGCWTVGVAVTGNCVGLTAEEWAALSDAERASLRAGATNTLRDAGAHYVIDGIGDLMPVVAEINQRLAAGERP
jgi:phosphonoacetaldehyde hydrolase